ncbi:AfsR/SARP family transcriptional regulator [Salinispira pacifica]
MSEFTFNLLGPPLLERSGRPVGALRRKATALLAYLATEGKSHSRDELSTLLWPEHGQGRARANLRRCLFSLNEASGVNLLATGQDTLRLDDSMLETDVARFRRLAAGCNRHESDDVCDDCIPLLEEAVEVYRSDFLCGFSLPDCSLFDEWQLLHSETLRLEFAALLARLAEALETRGRYGEALLYAERLLSLDTLEESSHRLMMRLYAGSGRRAAALRQYESCRRVLREELGEEPDATTDGLWKEIRSRGFNTGRKARTVRRKTEADSANPAATPTTGAFAHRETEEGRAAVLLAVALSDSTAGEEALKLLVRSSGRPRTDWPRADGSFCLEFAAAEPALDAAFALLDRFPESARAAVHAAGVDRNPAAEKFAPIEHIALLLSCLPPGEVVATESAVHGREGAAVPPGVSLRPLGFHRLADLREAEELFQALHPRFIRDTPHLHTLDTIRNNLPSQPERLVGRRREVARTVEALAAPDVRLVTLTGPAGTGKTRLALHAAAAAANLFPDGVFLVDLSPIVDAHEVGRLIVATLEVRDSMGPVRTAEELLVDYLRSRRLLLILDNFEHLLPAAGLVVELIGAAAGVKFLVTSRQRLAIRGERELSVPPLELPSEGADAAEVIRSESVELLLSRAALSGRSIDTVPSNLSALSEICRRLDGLPLAIELAAARLRVLTPVDLAQMLPHRLTLLKTESPDRPERQRTLESAIDWSFNLLDGPERGLFTRLAVFVGGFSLEAAEFLCAASDTQSPEFDVLDGISSLVEKNLLRSVDFGTDSRFSMLETIREYASRKYAEDPLAAAFREHHAAFYLQFSEEAARHLHSSDQMEWLDRLERDYENLQAALRRFVETGAVVSAARMCVALEWFWYRYAHIGDATQWLETVIDGTRTVNPEVELGPLRGRALRALAWHLLVRGDWQESRSRYLDAKAAAVEHGDRAGESLSLSGLGTVERWLGLTEAGRTHVTEAVEIARELRDPLLIMLALIWAYSTTGGKFEGEPPISELSEARLISRKLGDLWSEAHIGNGLGDLYTSMGRYDLARANYEQALTKFRELKDGWLAAWNLEGIARVEILTGEPEQACRAAREAVRTFDELGDRANTLFMLPWLGTALQEGGNPEAAATLFGAYHALKDDAAGSADFSPDSARVAAAVDASQAAAPRSWGAGSAMSYRAAIDFALAACSDRVALADPTP